jgi:superfamily II DNA or RNA helicase
LGRVRADGSRTTYPNEYEQQQSEFRIEDLIGGIVYSRRIDDLAGEQLADYRTERIRIDLTPDERTAYDADYAVYSGYFRKEQLAKRYGAFWLNELMRRSAFDVEARRALLARGRIEKLLARAEGKFAMLDRLLREHDGDQILVFTENNEVAYTISRRHLIPVITHETKSAERKYILEAFCGGQYRAIVTSKVLNEGVDVPEAKVAIVLGGTAHPREYIQRLGRVLRKVENRQAMLYEVIARGTTEEGKSQRRKPKA